MWLFTEGGFLSAIRYNNDKDEITVRARDKKSLRSLVDFTGAKIVKRNDTDYPYRVIIEDSEWSAWVAEQALKIDYPNFKNRVHQSRGKSFAHLLSDVWGIMLGAEKIELEEQTGRPITDSDFYRSRRF